MEDDQDRESFEQSYCRYIFCLKALAGSPEEACESYGHFNVAYEIQLDVSAGVYLCNVSDGMLSPEQERKVWAIANMVKALPEDAVAWATGTDESLRNMRHQSWAPVREEAELLVELLLPITEEDERYFS